MSDIHQQVFIDCVSTVLKDKGFLVEDAVCPVNQDAVFIKFYAKGCDVPGCVTASGRELRMNSNKEALFGLMVSRIKDAVAAFEASKAA